jgi:hypothetical protein
MSTGLLGTLRYRPEMPVWAERNVVNSSGILDVKKKCGETAGQERNPDVLGAA